MGYTKLFNTSAVLTSKNPEAFVTFVHNESPSGEHWIIPDISTIGRGILYINGLDVNNYTGEPSLGYALELNSARNVASFHVYTPFNEDFSKTLSFKIYDSNTFTTTPIIESIDIKNRPFIADNGLLNTFESDNILVDDETSYMILRTNPKYTGNIVLYVDSSQNLYLDTFKVSDILSNKKYRKQTVSSESVLSSDIRDVFSSLPLGELYRVDVDNTLSIDTPKTDVEKQFVNTYNYGAKLIKDELYNEDNGILAPLWINSTIPHYFAVFRLNGVYNPETYDSSSLSDLGFKYLNESKLIKSWSLREESPLGKYLNTHMTDITKIQSPLFLSLTSPESIESDPNTWYGIAVDKGVLTGRSETTYLFNQKANNYTDLNAFVSQGFERNTLLIPNLINIEFIFDDNDVSIYTMNRYFGLYLTENVLYKIGYYAENPEDSVEIVSLDEKDSSAFFHSLVFDQSTGDILPSYENRIFVLNDNVNLTRITNKHEIDESCRNNYISKPNKNIFNTGVEKVSYNPFMIITLNNVLEQGEHLRVINKSENKIWEIYSVDASSIECEKYCTTTVDASGIYPTVYRTYFDVNGDISDQIRSIEDAFDLFGEFENTPFRSGIRGNNWMSIILNDDASFGQEWLFQRISSRTLNNFNDPSSDFNGIATAEDLTFFGRFTPNSSDYETISYDALNGPIDFELYGNRRSISVNFIKAENNKLYSFDSSKNILDKFENPTLYQGTDKWYRKILNFDVSNNMYQYVKDPLSSEDKVLVITSHDIQLVNNQWNGYNIYPINISLMGINPVKDIDYTVYDISLGVKSQYKYNREDDASSYSLFIGAGSSSQLSIRGSYVVKSGQGELIRFNFPTAYTTGTIFNTFDTFTDISALTDTVITYAVLDGSYNYIGYKDGSTEENLSDYYDSASRLKYGLIVPFVSKWVGLGNDVRNNPLRLMLNNGSVEVSTNFIPDGTNFTQEISIPSFKYLTPGERAWQDYIFYDINDVILDHDSSTYLTFKELMFKRPYDDYFSKLMYSNYGVESTKTRSSITYYNQYKNSVDVIFQGLNLSIKVENVAKNLIDIKNYDRYRFAFISTSQRNKDNKRPIEVIINENTKTILMIWYQGNDELNYNMRYSSFLPGKSLFDNTGSGFMSGLNVSDYYSFVKTPFYVVNNTIQKTLSNYYGKINLYDPSTINPYAQFNKNLSGFSSVWNAFSTSGNTISGNNFYIDSDKNYQTFSQYVDYVYIQNANTFGDYVLNYGYNYRNNKNYYVNNTTNFNTLKNYLSSALTNVMYYVIREDDVYTSFDFGSNINPINIVINPPRTYGNMVTYNGWFKPNFNNILEFNSNENSELMSIVEKDFTFGNTNLRAYNYIPQLWYNKVVSSVTSTDILTGNAINFIKDYNVFKSLWDADYFIKDGAYVDGYESTEELSSFFGSKLPKLPNQINLEKWDSTMISSEYATNNSTITASFNLTRAIVSLFKSHTEFLANWSYFQDSDSVIDGYIKNTILTYYNLSQSKIVVNFYYKAGDGRLIHYENDSSFTKDLKQNFNGQLVYYNDEYIYRIVIPVNGNLSYFVSFALTEK